MFHDYLLEMWKDKTLSCPLCPMIFSAPEVGFDTKTLCLYTPLGLTLLEQIQMLRGNDALAQLPTFRLFLLYSLDMTKSFIGDVISASDYVRRGECCSACKHPAVRLTLYLHIHSNLAVRIVPSFFLWVFVCILSSYNALYCAAMFDSVDSTTEIFT